MAFEGKNGKKWEKIMGWDGVLFFSRKKQKQKKENAIKVETTRDASARAFARARTYAKREKEREEEGKRRQSRSFARTRGVLYCIKHIPDYPPTTGIHIHIYINERRQNGADTNGTDNEKERRSHHKPRVGSVGYARRFKRKE